MGLLLMMIPLAFFGSSMGAGEILLILVVGLLLFGAERLPAMARSLGKALENFRRAARDLTHDLMNSQHPPSVSETPPSLPPPSKLPSNERKG
ncbi:MAG: twin-arginine translocase TatA/TatE family subunit [Verrucomicrobiota bacterium]